MHTWLHAVTDGDPLVADGEGEGNQGVPLGLEAPDGRQHGLSRVLLGRLDQRPEVVTPPRTRVLPAVGPCSYTAQEEGAPGFVPLEVIVMRLDSRPLAQARLQSIILALG